MKTFFKKVAIILLQCSIHILTLGFYSLVKLINQEIQKLQK